MTSPATSSEWRTGTTRASGKVGSASGGGVRGAGRDTRPRQPAIPDHAPSRTNTICTPLGPVEIDDVSGPCTVVGLGEYCRVCEEPLEPGEVVVCVLGAFGAGVAHEQLGCIVDATEVVPDERSRLQGGAEQTR